MFVSFVSTKLYLLPLHNGEDQDCPVSLHYFPKLLINKALFPQHLLSIDLTDRVILIVMQFLMYDLMSSTSFASDRLVRAKKL